MTTPKAHVALSRFLDLTKSAQMTVPKGQNDRTKSGGPYQKRNENAMTVPNVRGSLPKLPNCGCGAGVATGRWARRHSRDLVTQQSDSFQEGKGLQCAGV